jgi:putative transposase
MPRDRDGDFQSQVLPRCQRYDERITEDIAAMYLTGISTRTLSLLSTKLIGRPLSPTEVSNSTTELKQAVEKWRVRDLSREKIKYFFIDGIYFRMRIAGITAEIVKDLIAESIEYCFCAVEPKRHYSLR